MKTILIALIRFYQIIPFSSHAFCRHTPRCSDYMITCLERFGVRKGLPMGLKRIKNCRPGGTFGYDPVPEKENDI